MEDPKDGEGVNSSTPPEIQKNWGLSPGRERTNAGQRARARRGDEIRALITRMDTDLVWDSIQAREVPTEIIQYVEDEIRRGVEPGKVCQNLGLNSRGGKNSKQWKKIQAFFRQGFRADAEAYLVRMTHDYFKTIDKVKGILDDAIENGVPIVEQTKMREPGGGFRVTTEVHQVRGATKELAAFLDAYSRAVVQPIKMWKDYGAISEQPGKGGGASGITIVVKTNVPTRSQAEVDAYRDSMLKKADQVIDVEHKVVES